MNCAIWSSNVQASFDRLLNNRFGYRARHVRGDSLLFLFAIASRTDLSSCYVEIGAEMLSGDSGGDDGRIDDGHPAIRHFTQRLDGLNRWRVQTVDLDGKLRRLTPKALHELFLEQAPDLAPSQTQMYRYYSREAAPDVVFVYEMARLLGVSPQWFLPRIAPVSTIHARLRPPQ
jgi:hypothetical protein